MDTETEAQVGKKRPRSPTDQSNNADTKNEFFAVEWQQQQDNANDRYAIVTIHRANVSICIQGRFSLQCRSGSMEILGYTLSAAADSNAMQKVLEFDSPAWTAWSTLTATEPNTIIHCHSRVLDTTETVTTITSTNNNDSPTFTIHSALVNGSQKMVPPTVIPETWKVAVERIDADLKARVASLQQHASTPAMFRESLDDHDDDNGNNANGGPNNINDFIIVVAGAKGVGKSTCARYTVNRLLSSGHAAVALLNTDPGQPELTPTGCMSLSTVTQPLLHSSAAAYNDDNGSNDNSNSVTHNRACFFGSTTSQTDPVRFLECVAVLIQSYRDLVMSKAKSTTTSNTTILPLVVNLDGWIKGLGEQILQAVLHQLLPHHVIQIVGNVKSKMFDLTEKVADAATTVLHVAHAYNTKDSVATIIEEPAGYYGPSSPLSSSLSPETLVTLPVQSSSMSAGNLRAHRLVSYFCGPTVWDKVGFTQNGIDDEACVIANRLAAMKPYVVPWEAVDWQHFALPDHCGEITSPDMILAALNGSVVGLCHRGENDNSENHLLQCVGLGLIRGIDRAQQLFYILTPVAPKLLATVNVLSRGVISLPAEFFFRGVHSECFPYQSCSSELTELNLLGAHPMKSRNSIARKGGGR